MIDNFCIVKSHPDIVIYVDHLQRKNAEALSFYPKSVFERESKVGRIFLGLLNGYPCGYLYVGAIGPDIKCHQVCIQYDARRKLYGASLVQAMEDYASEGGAYTITLRCGFDLEANAFWTEMGYGCIRISEGGIRRIRKINVWRKSLQSELFQDVKIEAAVGKTDASIWRKNKRTGLVSQFIRGRRLADYRSFVISQHEPKPADILDSTGAGQGVISPHP